MQKEVKNKKMSIENGSHHDIGAMRQRLNEVFEDMYVRFGTSERDIYNAEIARAQGNLHEFEARPMTPDQQEK